MRILAVATLVATAMVLNGCGSAGTPRSSGSATALGLHPAPPPAGWRVIRIPNGATLAYPPGWRRIRSDVGTGSAALIGPNHRILGYLNLTPRQGEETLANWSRFRVDHNGEEGDRAIVTVAAHGAVPFRTGRGSCLVDSYATRTANHYTELACLVAGRRATTVVVAAAPTASWTRISPILERAISSLST